MISSHLRRRDERISATREARLLRAAPALSARREEPIEHPFAARAAEGTRISLRWAAEVLEELQKHGMLLLEGLERGTFSRFPWAEMGARPRIEWY